MSCTDFAGVKAVVTGFGISGYAAADALQHVGAHVTVVDERPADTDDERVDILSTLGVGFRLGPDSQRTGLLDDASVVVTSPGWRPDTPILKDAAERGLEVFSEVELAWRLRAEGAADWLVVTGTNGKTTTTQMLHAILAAAGLRSAAVGNVGRPVTEAVLDPEPYDVLAVELSSYQLHWSSSLSPLASTVLNVAPDHVDWHGSFDEYIAAKGKAYERTQRACVYNVEDPVTRRLVEQADVVEGCRAIGFTLGVPDVSMVGVVDDIAADRAFVAERAHSAAELFRLDVLGADVPPHRVANAVAAAALARAYGVPPQAVTAGLAGFGVDAHRGTEVGRINQVRYIDDSKATNPHAALAALRGVDRAVWIAGGLAKGADFDDLVRAVADRLAAVVLTGTDADVIAQALARHAPNVPVRRVTAGQTDLMDRVVEAAADVAAAPEVVLLAPGCASMDQFESYGDRGDKFAAAVKRRAGSDLPTL